MTSLLKLRSERGQMSAIERRIADFILENAHLLRDYSSQQLANTLKISQSSVVKFSQKLGYKGYPDLKYSIGEALARDSAAVDDAAATSVRTPPSPADAERLWAAKSRAEEETRLLNEAAVLDAAAGTLARAETIYLGGSGIDAGTIVAFAHRVAKLGRRCMSFSDPESLALALAAATSRDVLLVACELGTHAAYVGAATSMRAKGGGVICVTRHCANPLRAHADHALLVSAIDSRAEVEPLLYQAAAQQLLDLLYLRVRTGAAHAGARPAAKPLRMRARRRA